MSAWVVRTRPQWRGDSSFVLVRTETADMHVTLAAADFDALQARLAEAERLLGKASAQLLDDVGTFQSMDYQGSAMDAAEVMGTIDAFLRKERG